MVHFEFEDQSLNSIGQFASVPGYAENIERYAPEALL